MARKVFFSFHYNRDAIRVSQIRESNSITQHFTLSRFLDKASWETIKDQGKPAVKNWIDTNMNGTSVVVLCYGLETYSRPWVRYELKKAYEDGRGIVAIDMSGMRNMQNQVDPKGLNPLDYVNDEYGKPLSSHKKFMSYSWEKENGRSFIDEWIEYAAIQVGR